jgi:transaldolase
MKPFENMLNVKLYADGADLAVMMKLANLSYIAGLTTNPTLMRKSGITNYQEFCKAVLREIKQKPISFEVFSDDFNEMYIQAKEISRWGENVFVKIPITNTKGQSSCPLVARLVNEGIKVNVTAIMTVEQVQHVAEVINPQIDSNVSIFAGRIADTGRDPVPIIRKSLDILSDYQRCEVIWASPRELLNIVQADDIGCHIITATSDILNKLSQWHRDLSEFSLETVQMFYDDAKRSGFSL